ncbi:hypothetical protein HPP92_028996 [Vanilla planifolia]|uniref:Uncharacterized protein n=1 Tax=Vanilla planifolia TaxID=51239 RepID=A0A835P5A7_VANPL|nr:hypothetical protein HPP92_028996 [Vanilla planifolia]KAG0446128.1 hypothetical protein HPP92_028985 [Vanilla planifolia]
MEVVTHGISLMLRLKDNCDWEYNNRLIEASFIILPVQNGTKGDINCDQRLPVHSGGFGVNFQIAGVKQ